MRKCMGTDKPLISILMAVYEPNMDWLREQLISLNEQTYPNLRLYIRDDCSKTVHFDEIQSCVKDCISTFAVSLDRNEKNLGSNLTFEQLTKEAEGAYFAYCDQDDVWLPEKLEILEKEICKNNAVLACSDVIVINANGKKIANSITEIRPRHIFLSGENLAGNLLYRNFIIGCTMLVDAKIARESCPFVKNMVHDHYLALYSSTKGVIFCCTKPLIRYRIHGGNQTGVLSGIKTKQDYINNHVELFVNRIAELSSRLSFTELETAQKWVNARKENIVGGVRGAYCLWKLRNVNFTTSIFEIIGLRLPNCLFSLALKLIQHGKI